MIHENIRIVIILRIDTIPIKGGVISYTFANKNHKIYVGKTVLIFIHSVLYTLPQITDILSIKYLI